ncbi:MAG TPA: subtilase family N-terminal domain-containing protein, partial [Candidatus Krumholzibacteria bacterium]|nr:subtilase family N-terminal domain-containing protein [Candidatus Krumholzibacteria bacterium]
MKRLLTLMLILGLLPAMAFAAMVPYAPVQGGLNPAAPSVLPWLPDRVVIQLTPAAIAASTLPTDKAGAPAKATGLPAVDAVLAEVGVQGIARAFEDLPSKAATSELGFDRWYSVDLTAAADIEVLVARLKGLAGVDDALPD